MGNPVDQLKNALQQMKDINYPEGHSQSAECLISCVGKAFQWVENILIEIVSNQPPPQMKIIIEHSYPEGVSIESPVNEIIAKHVMACVGYSVSYKRVKHGSGALRSARSKPAK